MPPGTGLHWREQGGGPATALLVHGYPLSSAIWEAQLAAVPDGWRFIAPDLPGFGDSPPPAHPAPTMDQLADELVVFMEELGSHRAVVCGLSMGGYVAFRLWARHPAVVAGLVLTNTRAAADTEEAKRARRESAELARRKGVGPIVESMLPRLLSGRTAAQHPEVVARLNDIMMDASVAGVVAALGAMADRPDSTPLLPRIAVPALVVAGAEDPFAPPAEMEAMAAAMPAAQFVMLPGVAHLSCMEDPAAFNAAVQRFLAGIRPD